MSSALFFSLCAFYLRFFSPCVCWMNESCTSATNKWMNEWLNEWVTEWVGGSYKNVANGLTKRCILKHLARDLCSPSARVSNCILEGGTTLRMLNICNSWHCTERKLDKCRWQIERQKNNPHVMEYKYLAKPRKNLSVGKITAAPVKSGSGSLWSAA